MIVLFSRNWLRKSKPKRAARDLTAGRTWFSMLFCHFAKSTTVREISNGLRSATGNLNHLSLTKAPSKSSISYQNKRRDSDLFRDLYYSLLGSLGQQASVKRSKLRIKVPVYLLDATVISLCLSVFDWVTFRTKKGAGKMHTLLEYEGKQPVYVNITEGSVSDNKGAYNPPKKRVNDCRLKTTKCSDCSSK